MIPFLFAFSLPAAADASADIHLVQRWHAEARRSAFAKRSDSAWAWAAEKHMQKLLRFLMPHAWEQVVEHGKRIGIPALHLNEKTKLKLENSLQARILTALKTEDARRYEALHKVLRESMGRRHAENFLAEMLGFSKTGSLLKQNPKSQGDHKPSCNSQSTLRSHINGFQIDPESSEILEDIGGAGSGNGIIDAGEWIHLNVGIKNGSIQRWHSTSGWFSFDSECSWVRPSDERIIDELNPTETTKEAIWIYISEHCEMRKIPLTLVVQDTHQTGGQPLATNMDVHLSKIDAVKPWAVLFDKDLPGSSKAQKQGKLYPGESMEINSGFDAGGSAISAQQAFEFGLYGNDLIKKSQHSAIEMPKVKDGLRAAGATGTAPPNSFVPGDDLDIETVDKATFYQALTSMGQAYGWKSDGDYQLLVGMDVDVFRPSPDQSADNTDSPLKQNAVKYRYRHYLKTPLMRWNISPIGTSEICGDGIDNDNDTAVDCEDTDCKALKKCAAPKEHKLAKPTGRKQPAYLSKEPNTADGPDFKNLSIDIGIPVTHVGIDFRSSIGKMFRVNGMLGGVIHIENTLLKGSLGGSVRFQPLNRFSLEPYVNGGMAYWAPEQIIASHIELGTTSRWEIFEEIGIFLDVLHTIPLHERLNGMPQSNLRFGISLSR